MKFIIFTDLDGTLLNKNYSFAKAKPSLKKIKKRKIPLVICTSKTRAEIQFFRKEIQNKEPFISENGGAIFIPKKYFPFKFKYTKEIPGYFVIEIGMSSKKLGDKVKKIKKQVDGFTTFTEMSIKELAKETGLSLKQAKLARKREYDIPIKINKKNSLKKIKYECKKQDLNFIQGTRYSHITGKNNKGKAVKKLLTLYKKKYKKENILIIGIGDSANDFPMLEQVNKGYLVQKQNKKYASRKFKKQKGVGPIGWNRIVKKILK